MAKLGKSKRQKRANLARPRYLPAALNTSDAMQAPTGECERLQAQLMETTAQLARASEETAQHREENEILRRQLAEAQMELDVSKRKLKSDLEAAANEQRLNDVALDEWRASWALAISALRLNEDAEPAAVNEVVSILGEIDSLSVKMESLQHRIDTMQRDEREYADTVQALAVRAGPTDFAGLDSLAAISKLQEAARVAQLQVLYSY